MVNKLLESKDKQFEETKLRNDKLEEQTLDLTRMLAKFRPKATSIEELLEQKQSAADRAIRECGAEGSRSDGEESE